MIEKNIKNKLISDCISEWIWERDLISGEILSTRQWLEFLGYKDMDIKQSYEWWTNITHPEDLHVVNTAVMNIKENKTDSFTIEFRIKHFSGEYKWVQSRGKAYRNKRGEAIYIAGLYWDISALKKIEHEEQKFHTLFDNIRDALFITKLCNQPEDEKFIEVNEATEEMLGYSKEELLSMSIVDIKPKELYEETLLNMKSIYESGDLCFETIFVTKDKSPIPVEVKIKLVNMDGEVLKLASIRDISLRKKEENNLKELKDRYRRIVDNSPSGILIHDDEVITYVNPKAEEMFGARDYNEIKGRYTTDFVHPEYQDIARKVRERAYEGVRIEPVEMEFRRLDGTLMDGEVSTVPVPYKNKTMAFTYINDISVQKAIMKENERLLKETIEYDRLKTEFFCNISHELRTPLNIILSSIQLLNLKYQNRYSDVDRFLKSYDNYIEVMEHNSHRLLKLVNNLIDITRIDAGFLKLKMSKGNIVETVENITVSVIPYTETKGITLTFDTETEERIMMYDQDKVERILLNLLSNAIKYNKPEGVIEVYVKEVNRNVIISVKDTGYGIPEDKKDAVFERFRQVDSLLTRKAEGSGIGLAMVKALVEMHKGSITLNTAENHGSEFIISLPTTLSNDFEEGISEKETKGRETKSQMVDIELSDIYI
jgi:PAS domain S-box-containing protein